MCGIAGLIHRDGATNVGKEMTAMLQSLKHRGPDFDGLRHLRRLDGQRICHAAQARRAGGSGQGPPHPAEDQGTAGRGRQAARRARRRDRRGRPKPRPMPSAIACAMPATRGGSPTDIEHIEGAEVLSFGSALELIKDLGDATQVSRAIWARQFQGHARHRPYPHGDGIRRRYPLGASLLGLSL